MSRDIPTGSLLSNARGLKGLPDRAPSAKFAIAYMCFWCPTNLYHETKMLTRFEMVNAPLWWACLELNRNCIKIGKETDAISHLLNWPIPSVLCCNLKWKMNTFIE